MAYAEHVHLPVGIPLMTDAALIRAHAAFHRQLASLSSEDDVEARGLRHQLEGAIASIEHEFRMREIAPDDYRIPETDNTEANVLRYVSVESAF